ncbi:MAG: PEGA domain-containing protein [Candidatus Marinimicrobia bacterium]|jgi:hypothetical protein|nr:PEGA domain-containing protein [Candidatus Neomarinimicrobiota bacterium]
MMSMSSDSLVETRAESTEAHQIVEASISHMGYISVKSDTLGTPIFIDGVFIGNTPVNHPIPVSTGMHEVSLIPSHKLDNFVKNRLHDSIKKIAVTEGDTLTVMLYFDYQATRIQAIRKEQKFTGYAGYTLLGIVAYLLWISAGG